MRFFHLWSAAAVGALASLAACDTSTNFEIDPILVSDTIEVFAPLASNSGLPTALDVASCGAVIGGARFPERAIHAGQWDFAIRLRGGALFFEPASLVGLTSRAGITRPLVVETFESVIEAPAQGNFVSDSAVVVQAGAIYAARSRDVDCGFGPGQQYSKLQVLAADPATGRVQVQLVTNERFSDLRLAPDD